MGASRGDRTRGLFRELRYSGLRPAAERHVPWRDDRRRVNGSQRGAAAAWSPAATRRYHLLAPQPSIMESLPRPMVFRVSSSENVSDVSYLGNSTTNDFCLLA